MRAFAAVLLVLSSAFAYQVTSPGNSQGWTSAGPNSINWNRVDTDPLNFTALLINQAISFSQVLDSVVDGTAGSLQVAAPSGGWPTGPHFRVNFAQDAQHLDSLLAQSNEFNITGSSSSGSTSTSASGSTASSASVQSVSVTGSVTASASGVSSSATSTTPTSTSAASLGTNAQAGLLTIVAALTALIITLA